MHNCTVCGNEVTRFIKSSNSWWAWCSNKCMGADPAILEKKKQTNLAKFGVEHPMHDPAARAKLASTVMQKYGVDNPAKSPVIQRKMKATFLAKYGVDNPSKNSAVIAKITANAISRFATDKDAILEKRKFTNIKKYGVETNKHLHIPVTSLHLMKDLEWLKHQHNVLNKSISQIADELGISPTPIGNFLSSHNVPVHRTHTSKIELEIVAFIKEHYQGTVVCNDRTIIAPHEIDILLPMLNLGIEVNGVYWHSEEKGKDKNYHLNKTKNCEAKNIHLIHVYDVEWNDVSTRQIIKSKLLHLLGKSTRIAARKCKIVVIPNTSAVAFLKQNHLQGSCPALLKLGVYYQNELVAVASLGKSRYNKQYAWELLRYCNRLNSTVIGGLSKVLKYARVSCGVKDIISYADRRWSQSHNTNLYVATGFTFLRAATPNYKYFRLDSREICLLSRNQFQKHLLSTKLETFDVALSEYENMSFNGYHRIWDCGNLVYIWNMND